MKNSERRMKSVQSRIVWTGSLWFIWGIAEGVAQWFHYDKPSMLTAILWFGLGGLGLLLVFIGECTKAILTRIDERIDLIGAESVTRDWD